MFGYRFLRLAAVGLWVYGLLGLFVAAAMLIVGLSAYQQVLSLQRTLESQRTALVQSVRAMSSTLRDTAGATADFQHSIDTARSSADQASRLSNDSAGTFRSLGVQLGGLTILGIQPLATLQPEFDRSADGLQQLAISLGTTREALGQNGTDVGRVGADLNRLQAQLDTLATGINQPGLLALDPRDLLPLQVAFFGMCLLLVVQSVFSIVAGFVVYRVQRALGAQPLFPVQPRTATTNGVREPGRVRAS